MLSGMPCVPPGGPLLHVSGHIWTCCTKFFVYCINMYVYIYIHIYIYMLHMILSELQAHPGSFQNNKTKEEKHRIDPLQKK